MAPDKSGPEANVCTDSRAPKTHLQDLIFRHWRFSCVCILIGAAFAGGISLIASRYYQASATLIATDDTGAAAGLSSMLGDLGSLASLAGVNLQSDQSKVEAEALIQSRQFTEQFISDNRLLPVLFPKRWDAAAKAWKSSWLHPKPPTLYDGYKKFDNEVRAVSEDKKTGLVTLTIEWTDAETAASWANDLVQRLNEAMRQRSLRESDASIQLLGQEMKNAQLMDMQQAIARSIETYVKQRTLANIRKDYAFRIIDPAKAPDTDDYVRPQPLLYVLTGSFVGFLFTAVCLSIVPGIRRWLANH